jgi:hypothetical protein
MERTNTEKIAEREFRRYARKNLPHPGKVKNLELTQQLLQELHVLMNDFKRRFNYVPEEACLKFDAYKNIQDSMVYDGFKKSYQPVLC